MYFIGYITNLKLQLHSMFSKTSLININDFLFREHAKWTYFLPYLKKLTSSKQSALAKAIEDKPARSTMQHRN